MLYCHRPLPAPPGAHKTFRNKRYTHLTADTQQELIDYALSIGMKREWLQHGGTYKFHFDIVGPRLEIVLKDARVKVLTLREFACILKERR